jgi:UDP-N-acetyl-D-glucosamine dehydrogenase
MPRFVIYKVQDAHNDHGKPAKDSNILVLGAAYKPDIDDLRESPALDVIGLLIQKGANVSYHDPYISELEHDEWKLHSVKDLGKAVSEADCVVIVTNHSSYDYKDILQKAHLIVDTRNALGKAGKNNPKVVRL